jgi:hypothetical protein
MLDRLGLGRGDRENQDLRFCKCHPAVEEKRFSIKSTIRNEDEEEGNEAFSVTKLVKGVPKPIGPKRSETPATSDLKGSGGDRMAL